VCHTYLEINNSSKGDKLKPNAKRMTIDIANLTVRQTKWENQYEKAFGELK